MCPGFGLLSPFTSACAAVCGSLQLRLMWLFTQGEGRESLYGEVRREGLQHFSPIGKLFIALVDYIQGCIQRPNAVRSRHQYSNAKSFFLHDGRKFAGLTKEHLGRLVQLVLDRILVPCTAYLVSTVGFKRKKLSMTKEQRLTSRNLPEASLSNTEPVHLAAQ